ncbi:trimethylamine methyltransferase family protein [Eubacterium aggregans]|uniref:trimethylamine methyltransferase family protein n=1 Tax=Eubacterium aggregans TaxID=81409 RepID=UPI003F36DAA0
MYFISKADIQKIHETSLKILADVGVNFENEEVLEIFKQHGARVDATTVFMDEKMVMAALSTIPPKLHSGKFQG